ncbi:protein MEMO1-like [Dysidea avara]|uniref:protein MEMO1-like n=1 Tax=Dysidea avara TaxID=196820 RepID=UPI00332A0946
MAVRAALHSGSWYSSSGKQLDAELQKYLDNASMLHSPARAIIAPHAGYSYCGPCGAYAYKQINPDNVNRVFILGPSHHVYLRNCALSSATVCQTPLYDMEIDQQVYKELRSTGHFDMMDLKTDEEEHSIEMHLPYTAKMMESKKGRFTIVPVLVGALKRDKEKLYGNIFSKYLMDPTNLFVISSDFCHWGSRFKFTYYDESHGPIHSSIEKLDKMGMAEIESLSSEGFAKYLDKYSNTICGRHPIGVLLQAIDHLKSTTQAKFQLKFLHYAQSSKCKSYSDSSVSYAAASLTIE